MTTVPVRSIQIPENRQRKEMEGIESLTSSIIRYGLINPILITRENILVAGQRRLTAVLAIPWEEISVTYTDEIDPKELHAIELEENIKRMDLTWQEQARAIGEYYTLKDDNVEITAEALSLTPRHIRRVTRVVGEMDAGNEKVLAADTFSGAANIVQRQLERTVDNELSKMMDVDIIPKPKEEPADGEPTEDPPTSTPPAEPISSILCGDFCEWASTYSGPKFNFLHCDFPYGINHDKSDQGNARTLGEYEDSADVYWTLCKSLADNIDRLLYPSAHMIFWFSMNYYRQTIEFIEKETSFVLSTPHPLIWHKTDNKGIVSDVERRPRHVYETAFLFSRGDRKIISPVSDTYGAPTVKTSHTSEKPEPMLKHFFGLLVDDLTEMLDPTCGSGSSLRAAEACGASRVLGLELNPEFADQAAFDLSRHRKLRSME